MSDCSIEPLQPQHREGVLDTISTAFANDDPLARSQRIDAPMFRILIDDLFSGFLSCEMSYVARDPSNARIAAVVLADRFDSSDEGSDAIAAIIDEARRQYLTQREVSYHGIAHIHFIASAREYRQQGLVQKVVEACLQQARELQFERVIVEASGIASKTMLEKYFGFACRVVVTYEGFRWQGGYPFTSITAQQGLSLLELDLTMG